MINVKDLRIGNWVKCGGFKRLYGEFKVAEIYPDQITIEQKPYDGFTVEEVEPIPLTPEILEKCGFVPNAIGQLAIEILGIDTHLELITINDGYCYLNLNQIGEFSRCQDISINRIQYLYQLQNLYFALTGQELTYNQ
jgi:hypothetical protein